MDLDNFFPVISAETLESLTVRLTAPSNKRKKHSKSVSSRKKRLSAASLARKMVPLFQELGKISCTDATTHQDTAQAAEDGSPQRIDVSTTPAPFTFPPSPESFSSSPKDQAGPVSGLLDDEPVAVTCSAANCHSEISDAIEVQVPDTPENGVSVTPPDPESQVPLEDQSKALDERECEESESPSNRSAADDAVCSELSADGTTQKNQANPVPEAGIASGSGVGSVLNQLHRLVATSASSSTTPALGAGLQLGQCPSDSQADPNTPLQQNVAANPLLAGSLAPIACYTKFPDAKLNISSALLCPLCWFPKTSLEELEAHICWDHWKWMPFQCSYCPAVFRPTQFTLRLHLKEVHPGLPQKIICSIDDEKTDLLQKQCQKSVQGLLHYKNHIMGQAQALGLQHPLISRQHGFPFPFPMTNLQSPAGQVTAAVNQPCQPDDGDNVIIIDQPVKQTAQSTPRNNTSSAVSSRNSCPDTTAKRATSFSGTGHGISTVSHSTPSAPFFPGNDATSQGLSTKEQQQLPPVHHQNIQDPVPHISNAPEANSRSQQKQKQKQAFGTNSFSGQIKCQHQQCSAVVSSRLEVVHGHIYDHIHKSGMGYRYSCADCGYSCIRKGDLYAHNNSVHDRLQGRHKDRTQELANTFAEMRQRCFPNYDAEVTGTVVCRICGVSVNSSKKSAHIHRAHLRDKTRKCGYCSYTAIRSCGDIRKHIRVAHPGLPLLIVDLMYTFEEKMEDLKKQCFGCNYEQKKSSTSKSSKKKQRAAAVPSSTFDLEDGQLPVEVECGLGDGVVVVDIDVGESSEDGRLKEKPYHSFEIV